MKLSTRARYAVRSMVAISRLSVDGQPVSLERVAKRTHLSRRYLEQLASKLKQASLVHSVSGRSGGYLLAKAPGDIRIGHIVEATIGPINIVDCVLEPDTCFLSDSCECRTLYCDLNAKIRQVLNGYTLADLASGNWQETLAKGTGPEGGRQARAGASHERREAMGQDTEKKIVLVVDDEPDELSYLTTLLEDNEYGVVTAKDGDEALAIVRRDKPDLVTLDMSMPKKSGLRFYRELKGDPGLAKTPVVVVTAVTGFGGDPEAFKKFLSTRDPVPPPEGFVAKPIDKQELLKTVADLLV